MPKKRICFYFIIAIAVLSIPYPVFSSGIASKYGLILAYKEDNIKPISDFATSVKAKSPTKAFLYSAIIPGSGELYVGKKRGIGFMVAEVALLSAYFVLNSRADDLRSNYVSYVDGHIAFEPDSPATSTKDWTLEDYEHATQADNWHYVYTDNNGVPIDRVGKFYWKDLPEDMIDESGEVPLSKSNSKFRAIAYGKRGSANKKYKQAKMYLSVVVLNHVASAIDARIATIIQNKRVLQVSTSAFKQNLESPCIYLSLNNDF